MTAYDVAFAIPYYEDGERSRHFLELTVDALHRQTEEGWLAFVVDDRSPSPGSSEFLEAFVASQPSHVRLLRSDRNRGQGYCRNLAIEAAAEAGATTVLFNDADDISHPERVAVVREVFRTRPDVDMVYSTFRVVDENGAAVAAADLTPSIREILESHLDPIEGAQAWIEVGRTVGYTTLTSTVAVRTALARSYPFPEVRVSEDTSTWFRWMAAGGALHYVPDIPSDYRIPQDVAGSAVRQRVGQTYYQQKAEVDTWGFVSAAQIALDKEALPPSAVPVLVEGFLKRLEVTMRDEGQDAVVTWLQDRIAEAGDGKNICFDPS